MREDWSSLRASLDWRRLLMRSCLEGKEKTAEAECVLSSSFLFSLANFCFSLSHPRSSSFPAPTRPAPSVSFAAVSASRSSPLSNSRAFNASGGSPEAMRRSS